jgi:hypothetical protein
MTYLKAFHNVVHMDWASLVLHEITKSGLIFYLYYLSSRLIHNVVYYVFHVLFIT